MNDSGLPERIEDVQQATQLAGLLKDTGTPGVVLSGRCGACGYLLESAGHAVTCG